jgi:hypothetical protein
MMRGLRRMIYRLGFRPRGGSVFYSPSLSFIHSFRRATDGRG